MRILKIKVNGMKLFPGELEIDFTTTQRVRNDNSEMLHKISPHIYQNNAIALYGINASGKTTTLKVISFVFDMLNNKSLNEIENNCILKDMEENEKINFDVYFCTSSDTNESIFKLETTITKSVSHDDMKENFYIESEQLWEKSIKSIRTKKTIFDFSNISPIQVRKGDEEFLPDDISIIISQNKKNNTKINFRDLIKWTNLNFIKFLGKIPQEIISYLDPSIEYLNLEYKDENNIKTVLKFKGKDEILIDAVHELEDYLSSGTIKGINVFTDALFVLSRGGYLIIDEIENHFNKELATTLVRFFMDYKVNKNGSVILFTSHYPELLDEFERNDNIYITKNNNGIKVENLSNILKRNDIKKSEIYQSGYLEGTTPSYETFMDFKKAIINWNVK